MKRQKQQNSIKLLPYIKGYVPQAVIAPIFKFIESLFELLIPTILARIIDEGIPSGDMSFIYKHSLLILVMAIIGTLSALVCQYQASYAGQGFGTSLRNKLFSHVTELSSHQTDAIGIPHLNVALTNDINNIQHALAMTLRLVTRAPFLAVGAVIMSMMINFKLSLILVVVSPLVLAVMYFFMVKGVGLFNQINKKFDATAMQARDNIVGARVVRAFSKQKQENNKFAATSDQLSEAVLRAGKITTLINPLTFAIINLGIVALLWRGGFLVDSGTIKQGQIIAIINYMGLILLAMTQVAFLTVIYTKAQSSARRVKNILMQSNTEVYNNSGYDYSNPVAVEFKNISFCYSNGKESLKDVSFKIPKGKRIGIIGGTGSGKTTLVSLLLGFYPITQGNIEFFGKDIKDGGIHELRQNCSYAPQHISLLNGTIRDNLLIGNPQASDEQIFDVLKTAQIYDLVNSLPNGLDSQIAQSATNFSGGEKQRLALARALIKDSQVLILDDCINALDYITEAKLKKQLQMLDKTIILVTQRVSQIKDCDEILVFDEGKLISCGSFDNVHKNCEMFKKICDTQGYINEVAI